MVSHNCFSVFFVVCGCCCIANLNSITCKCTVVKNYTVSIFCCVSNFKCAVTHCDNTCVANLSATFSIERCFIENKNCISCFNKVFSFTVTYKCHNSSICVVFYISCKLCFYNILK